MFGKEHHVLFQDAQSLVSQSSTMLREFKEMDERLEAHRLELPVSKWKQDKRLLLEMVDCGHQEAKSLIESLLVPNSRPAPKTDKPGFTDIQAMKLLEESNKAAQGENWGTTAAEQAAQLTTIVRKLLPEVATNKAENE